MVNERATGPIGGQSPPRLVPSTRFTLALLVFFAFVVQYSQRVNLAIAIVCMVNRTQPINSSSVVPTDARQSPYNTPPNFVTSLAPREPTTIDSGRRGYFQTKKFFWNEEKQQDLLGGYWAGYIFTQIPGGWLATTLGAKWVYACSLGTSSLATLAITAMYLMSSTQVVLIFILRFVIGLSHGVLFPATIALWSLWAVPQERSTLASIGFCGTHLGTSLTMLVGGVFCRYLDAGWMYLFMVSALLGFIWLILWVSLTANSPNEHKGISAQERDYICHLTGSTGKKRAMSLASIPWKNIVQSKPLIALMITHIANLFGLFFFLTNFGKILSQLLRLPSQLTGYILAFGFFLTLLSSLTSGIATDRLIRSNVLTLTTARKLFNSLTSFLPALCMASLYFCDHTQQVLGVITVLVFLASSGLGYGSGYIVNFADIVPAYSGVIFGIGNTFASLAGFLGNIIAGKIVKEPVLAQWRILYVMFGIVYVIGGLVFVLFGSAIPRKWAKIQMPNASAKQEEQLHAEEAMPMNEKV